MKKTFLMTLVSIILASGQGWADNPSVFNVTVEVYPNRAPVFDPIGTKSVYENTILDFKVNATDADGDTLTYSASNLPSGATFDPQTNTFTWTPTYKQAGIYSVHFEVSDGVLIDSEDITITVNNVPTTIEVGGPEPDYNTIQEAIDNAQPADTIHVHPAEYAEDIILTEGVSLVGVGEGPVIVNGKIDMANNSSVENITFEHEVPGTNPYTMLNIATSDVTVKDCNFRLSQHPPRLGFRTDKLANISGNNITLEGNDFYFESSSSRFMRGICANQSKNLTLRGNRIHLKGDTAWLSYYLIGVSLASADNPTFENNVIHLESNNAWMLNGLALSACDNALAKNNTIFLKSTRPYISQLTGISVYQIPHINIRNNIISFEGNLQNPYYTYYPYSTYLKPCSITGDNLTGDTAISLTYNIYNTGNAFLYKSPNTLAVTEHNNIKGETQFLDKELCDFHLTEDSIAIDRGDPSDNYSKEPEPNGGRINCGSYGNTQDATTTPAHIATHAIFASALEGGTITPKGSILVNDGNGQTFTITPSYYYDILDVLLDDVSESVTGNTYAFQNVTSDHTILARFERKPFHVINARAGYGGTISPSGNVEVVANTSQKFYITPNGSNGSYGGYHIEDVVVDGVSIGAVSTYEFTNVNTNHSIEALFSEGLVITAKAKEGGTISPEGENEVTKGESLYFYITSYEGYRIKDVLVDGYPVETTTNTNTDTDINTDIKVTYSGYYTFTDIQRSHIIEATFAKETYELNVDTEGSGSVSITPSRQEYEYGTYVTLKAVPNEGYYFSYWSGDTENISYIYGASTYIIMRDNASIVATFASYGEND